MLVLEVFLAIAALAALVCMVDPELGRWLGRTLRLLVSFALATSEHPPGDFDQDRYPKTPRGGWRYFREVVAPAEIAHQKRRLQLRD